MSVGYGPSYSVLWEDCALDGWSLRTHRGQLPGFPPSSIDWPASVSWDERGFSAQPPLAPATDGSGGSLLPTPCAQPSANTAEAHLAKKERADGSARSTVTDLQVLVTGCLLPTPNAADALGGRTGALGVAKRASGQKVQETLAMVATALLPTPTASDARGTDATAGHQDGGLNLTSWALLPTPKGHDAKGHDRRAGHRPTAAELLTALSSPACPTAPPATTAPPSDDMRLF